MTLLCPSHLDISPTVVSVKIKQEGISLMMKNNKITGKKKKTADNNNIILDFLRYCRCTYENLDNKGAGCKLTTMPGLILTLSPDKYCAYSFFKEKTLPDTWMYYNHNLSSFHPISPQMFEQMHWILRPMIQPLLDVNSYSHRDIKCVWYSLQHPCGIAAYVTKNDNAVYLLMESILFVPNTDILRIPIPLEKLVDQVVVSSIPPYSSTTSKQHHHRHFYSLGKHFGICCLSKSHVNDAVKSFIVYRTDLRSFHNLPVPVSEFPFTEYVSSENWGPFLLYLRKIQNRKTQTQIQRKNKK